MAKPSSSFTLTSNNGLLNVLITPVAVCQSFDPATLNGASPPNLVQFDGIWDTGATSSVITEAVVAACGLKPTGMVNVHGVHGSAMAETFLINIRLPNTVGFRSVKVTKGVLTPNAQLLIGMDIIAQGDFSISNQGGSTVFSFRVPSCHTLDFVKDSKITGTMLPKNLGQRHRKRR